MKKLMHDIWRKLVFWVGDIKKIKHFPFVTWHVESHEVSFEEATKALKLIKAGDIGLHRDSGFLSNFFIGGCFVHGWYHLSSIEVVEAISEGVVKRHSLYPMHSDMVVILRPKRVNKSDITEANRKAEAIIGCQYDANFKFDIESEIDIVDTKEVTNVKENMLKYDKGFSCTEVVSFCWYHMRDQLGIFRKNRSGREIITADDFLNNSWEIVWLSASCTSETCKKLKLPEEGLEMINNYWRKHNA